MNMGMIHLVFLMMTMMDDISMNNRSTGHIHFNSMKGLRVARPNQVDFEHFLHDGIVRNPIGLFWKKNINRRRKLAKLNRRVKSVASEERNILLVCGI